MPVVLFEPQDLMLVLGSPGVRREYLDGVLSQAHWQYARAWSVYHKAIRQRNRLLWLINEGKAAANQLHYWNQLLVEQGQYLAKERTEYLTFINGWLAAQEQAVTFEAIYKPSEISLERLDSHYTAEVASGTTLVGPHRDEVEIRITRHPGAKVLAERQELAIGSRRKSGEIGLDSSSNSTRSYRLGLQPGLQDDGDLLATYGSRGQQRLGVLNLKLAELEYLTEKLDTRPILLLDDIFSELDEENRKIVIKAVGQYQTVIATTEAPFFTFKGGTVIQLVS